MRDLAADLEERLRAVATPERAEHEKRYLKSDLTFLGAGMSEIRAAVRDLVQEYARMTHDDVVALAVELWRDPVHERRMAAVGLLARQTKLLDHDDLLLVERLVRESRTWALVDGIAGDVLGRLVHATRRR